MQVEHQGRRGGGETVRKQREADDGDVLERERGPGEEVREEVILVIPDHSR